MTFWSELKFYIDNFVLKFYDKAMKKKKFISILLVFTTCLALAFSLTACMKIGMKKNNLVKKLQDSGASVEYLRTTPMTAGESGYNFEDLILSKMTLTDDDGAETEEELYVIFAADEYSADWAEERCKSYISENAETLVKWNVYRYDRVILCGHYKILAVARGY